MTKESLIETIEVIAKREIGLCTTQEQLLFTKKRWDKYLAGLNKFFAGKGTIPYFDKKGNVCYED